MLDGFTAGDNPLLAGLLAAGLLLLVASQFVRVPYPILLVLGGLAIAFIPGMPEIELPPDLVLVAVLPPLLYGLGLLLLAPGAAREREADRAAGRRARADHDGRDRGRRARDDPGLGWAGAFVLGAIVSPTDPTAATAIAQRLGLPRRLLALIEGESLVNDGTALVAYKFAVAAVVTGSFSLARRPARFVLSVVGGIAVGLAVGYLVRQLRRRLDNPPVEITVSLLTGYFAYLPAQARSASRACSPRSRSASTWAGTRPS